MTTTPRNKGEPLELKTAAYFQRHGFLVRRAVKLSVAASSGDITDIDVLAIRFGVPLAETRLVADCKDRRRGRPFQRILWTLGLAQFARAHHAVIVLPSPPRQAREFAQEARVEVLSVDSLEASDDSQSLSSFGDADGSLVRQYDRYRVQSRGACTELARQDERLRQMLVVGHPLTNLNRIIQMLSSSICPAFRLGWPVAWVAQYVSFDAAVVASVMLTRFASECKWMPEHDWSAQANARLTYGDVSPQKAQRLAQLAFEQGFYNGLPAPEYADEVVHAIGYLIAHPEQASILPYLLDRELLGHVLGGKPRPQPPSDEWEEAERTAKRVVSILAFASGIPMSSWTNQIGPPARVGPPTRQDQPEQHEVDVAKVGEAHEPGSTTTDEGQPIE